MFQQYCCVELDVVSYSYSSVRLLVAIVFYPVSALWEDLDTRVLWCNVVVLSQISLVRKVSQVTEASPASEVLRPYHHGGSGW